MALLPIQGIGLSLIEGDLELDVAWVRGWLGQYFLENKLIRHNQPLPAIRVNI